MPPTDTPTAGPTAAPSHTATPVGRFFSTEFDDLEDWFTFSIPEDRSFTVENRNGKLRIEVGAFQTTAYAFYDRLFSDSDVQIDAAVETVGGPNRNNISLVCRATGVEWYEFSMYSGGLWEIWRHDEQGGYTSLASGGSTAIHLRRARNELRAVCQGDRLTLIVNGVEMGSVIDSRFQTGYVGVSVSTFDISGAAVEFDWLRVAAP